MPKPNPTPVASAILATYNSVDTLPACLSSLLTQTVPLEIIVVDDGSQDATPALLRRFPSLLTFKLTHRGPALARNFGASHASTNILLFVDADMTFAPTYAATLIKPIQQGKVIGTYSVSEHVANWEHPLARAWNLQEGWADALRFPAHPPRYGTDFRAILKSEFERVGGFDHIGYTDTWSLYQKLGFRPLATKAACYHKNPDTLRAVFRQARWSAKRPYRAGMLGTLYALLRTSPPVSLVLALYKSIRSRAPAFPSFKLVYDLGRFIGIIEMLVTGKLSK